MKFDDDVLYEILKTELMSLGNQGSGMRRFKLQRLDDVTGISGTGIVAEGVKFSDGTIAIRWKSEYPSTVVWQSIEDAIKVHGHDGKTEIIWID